MPEVPAASPLNGRRRALRVEAPAPEPRTAANEYQPGDLVRTFIGKAALEAEVVSYAPPRARDHARILPGFKVCGCPNLSTEHPGKVTMETLVHREKMVRTVESVEMLTPVEARGK